MQPFSFLLILGIQNESLISIPGSLKCHHVGFMPHTNLIYCLFHLCMYACMNLAIVTSSVNCFRQTPMFCETDLCLKQQKAGTLGINV